MIIFHVSFTQIPTITQELFTWKCSATHANKSQYHQLNDYGRKIHF